MTRSGRRLQPRNHLGEPQKKKAQTQGSGGGTQKTYQRREEAGK